MRVSFAGASDMSAGTAEWAVLGLIIVSAAVGLVLLLVQLSLNPPASDLTAIATFLAISGGATVALALGLRRSPVLA